MSNAKEAPDRPSQAPQQKGMTKAERRELQEKQRAAKLAQKQQQQAQPASPAKSKPPASSKKQDVSKTAQTAASTSKDAVKDPPGDSGPDRKGLRIFSHFSQPKPIGQGVKGFIHPAIIRLGLHFAEFRICGANARCIATLTTFKQVIQNYVTPPNNTLSRHLMTHISPQISYLVSARPMSVTMGNAIRQLKLEISESNIDLPEKDAKQELCNKIDTYIHERIIMADEVIQQLANSKINDGDTILTYARSSVVQKVLLYAHKQGKRFSVIAVDSRPLLEGKSLLKALTSTSPPIPCTYSLISALPAVITDASIVFLGAHSLHSNGAVYSRSGTAVVAMMAKEYNVPVVVCCETYKFSENIALDGFGKNETAPKHFSLSEPSIAKPNFEVLDPLYDTTPPTCITAVVTEVGLIPPSSISSIPGRTTAV